MVIDTNDWNWFSAQVTKSRKNVFFFLAMMESPYQTYLNMQLLFRTTYLKVYFPSSCNFWNLIADNRQWGYHRLILLQIHCQHKKNDFRTCFFLPVMYIGNNHQPLLVNVMKPFHHCWSSQTDCNGPKTNCLQLNYNSHNYNN